MTDKQFDKDTWQTPQYVFNWLDSRFLFDVDGCANNRNNLCFYWIGKGCDEDSDNSENLCVDFTSQETIEKLNDLSLSICRNVRIFVNPPYSDVSPFIKQAKRLRDKGHTVVMLLNNDKSTQWYQQHIHNVANEVIDIIGGRIAFIHPVTGKEIKGNSKGQMVVVFDPTMEDFVQRSVSLDFVKQADGYGEQSKG
ncbi:MAG: phage N-6-adenine-methyltransferase [[Actinobacillus] rossii]|uniref:DNA methylase n=1 Tax=[Actinobacillus] rossii TaxID=123820 RepID=A0A380TYH2_9PAST|nr:phage N-6-adenine-methyltransferase [[Actinobacillus] rossii]MDY3122861.1 phage N-6-adenine-methyltransferase [[Actinobacillus] rossii]SUT93703.1 DNA methylase [[Actinobacillus] rossii]